jgi:Group II intron, maturase-specific domain
MAGAAGDPLSVAAISALQFVDQLVDRRLCTVRWGTAAIPITEADLARRINPVVRGWMNYYGAFYRSALYPLLARINAYLMRWLRKKHKRLRGRKKAREAWERAVAQRQQIGLASS